MLQDAPLIGFAATADGARARRFYEGTLGLRVISDDGFALALDAGGTMLRIQKVEHVHAAPYTALGWRVASLADAVDDLTARGVAFTRFPGLDQDARGVWRSPGGAQVAWFADPDGNILSLTQLDAGG
ncbi:MAG: VOC family protein [Kofleriaceae bacterium]|nr:VOC family protein [Myxococcales bacterium]MCB9560530.1 VOC family protein [Kofleriaceae bacterium]MCB9573292.1 VOC family protein [Kofleriaceae bacterium]